MSHEKVLVIGAADGSLGAEIRMQLMANNGYAVSCAGINQHAKSVEQFYMDVTQPQSIYETLRLTRPDHIICTAGVESGMMVGENGFRNDFENAFRVNVFGVIDVLNIWLQILDTQPQSAVHRHFVAISSNSAHIARTASAGYCASKAALSMAIRVAGREQARERAVAVYGYEPGLLAHTPMTRRTAERLPGVPLTRMPGLSEGIPISDLASLIVSNLSFTGEMFNGTMMRVDAGEQ